MNKIITPRRAVFAAVLASSVLAFVACGGGSTNPAPTGSSSSGGTGGMHMIVGANSSSGTTNSSSVTTSSSSTSTSTSTSTSSSSGSNCVMNPVSNTDFLNACNTLTCNPYSNATHIPSYDGGTLPPLM
jgi:hypothetical protein